MTAQQIGRLAKYINLRLPYYDIFYQFETRKGEGLALQQLLDEEEMLTLTIDLKKHIVLEWKPEFGSCDINAKVCDNGTYKLLDKEKKPFYQLLHHYVPNGVVPPSDGGGDYVEFSINADGGACGWNDGYSYDDFAKSGSPVSCNGIIATMEDVLWLRDTLASTVGALALPDLPRQNIKPYTSTTVKTGVSDEKYYDNETLCFSDYPQLGAREKRVIEHSPSLWISPEIFWMDLRRDHLYRLKVSFPVFLYSEYYHIDILDKDFAYGELPSSDEMKAMVSTIVSETHQKYQEERKGVWEVVLHKQ